MFYALKDAAFRLEESMSDRVKIKPSLIEWALDRSGDRSKIEMKFPKMDEWISGTRQPTFKQLEELSQSTLTPLGYFFLDEPPEEKLPIPLFRTMGDQSNRRPSAELLETYYTMERRQSWMREYLIDLGHDKLPFVGSARLNEKPVKIASDIRNVLNLPELWASGRTNWTDAMRFFRDQIEQAGVLVFVNGILGNNTHRKLDVEEFRGFVVVDDFAPLIFVNGADAKSAQLFTLAHELAHVWFGKSAAFDFKSLEPADDPIERACDRVAAEFLVPENDLLLEWSRVKDHDDRFQRLARKYKVSEIVAARRALDLKRIDQKEFFDFYNRSISIEKQKSGESSGGDYYTTQKGRLGSRFSLALIRAVESGELLFRDAYRLTGMNAKTFDEFCSRLKSSGE